MHIIPGAYHPCKLNRLNRLNQQRFAWNLQHSSSSRHMHVKSTSSDNHAFPCNGFSRHLKGIRFSRRLPALKTRHRSTILFLIQANFAQGLIAALHTVTGMSSTRTVICPYGIYIYIYICTYVHSVSEIPFAASQQSTHFASGGYSGLSAHSFTAVPKPRSSRKKESADLSNSKKVWHLPVVVGEEVAHLSLMQQREHEVMFTPFLRSLSPPANKAHILQAGAIAVYQCTSSRLCQSQDLH